MLTPFQGGMQTFFKEILTAISTGAGSEATQVKPTRGAQTQSLRICSIREISQKFSRPKCRNKGRAFRPDRTRFARVGRDGYREPEFMAVRGGGQASGCP